MFQRSHPNISSRKRLSVLKINIWQYSSELALRLLFPDFALGRLVKRAAGGAKRPREASRDSLIPNVEGGSSSVLRAAYSRPNLAMRRSIREV